jgi:hypothetical protein
VIFSAVYLLVRCLLGCLMVLAQREVSKDAELLVLRHENTVLRRQISQVRYQPGDRLWLAALSWLIPRQRWAEVFAVTPATLLAWRSPGRHYRASGRRVDDAGGPQRPHGPRSPRGFSQVPDQGPRWPVHRLIRCRVHRSGRQDSPQPATGAQSECHLLIQTLEQASPGRAVIVGADYIGLEMADALTTRGLAVTQMEQLPEVLPTVDPELGALVHAELASRQALASLLNWLTHNGQAEAAALGYVPLPPRIQQLARSMLQQITGPTGTHLLR